MPENIEKILRTIHIILSKGEMFGVDPDKVVVSKREMFDALEALNYGVVEVMDRYEATTRAKEKAKQELEQVGQSIIDNASLQAEDVYAASLLYTDGALNEVYAEIVEAKKEFRREYAKLEEDLDGRLEVIRSNQKELMDQLRALSQGKKYFALIEDYNKKIADAEKAATEPDQEVEAKETGNVKNKKDSAEKKNAPVIPEAFRKKNKKGDELPSMSAIVPAEEEKAQEEEARRNLLPLDEDDIVWPDEPMEVAPVEVKYNQNWGSRENNVLESGGFKTKKERDREKKFGKKPAKKKSKYDFGDEEIQLTVDPDEDPDAAPSFTSDDLDAEYLRWQDNQANAPSGDASDNDGDDSTDNADSVRFEDLISKATGLFSKKKKK